MGPLSGRKHMCISADPALRVERRGSPLFHFLGHLGSLGSCCARNGFWCCHNIRPKLGRSLICDNRSSQCPYCVLFSRLGSLTTVLTWLRTCSSLEQPTKPQPSPFFGSAIAPTPPPTLSCNQGPWSTPPSTRPAPVGTPPPPHRASFKKRHFSSFCTR